MARKRRNTVTVKLYKHGLIWWLCIGWWWRPCLYIHWVFMSSLCRVNVQFLKQK